MAAGDDQVPCVQVAAWPVPSTVTQKYGVGHETELKAEDPSMSFGRYHVAPSQRIARPAVSTARQNGPALQETPAKGVPSSSTFTGGAHAPFHSTALPWESTATQRFGSGHETAVSPDGVDACVETAGIGANRSGSAVAALDHDEPFHVAACPLLVTAMQSVGDAQDTPFTAAPLEGNAATTCHCVPSR